MPSKKVILHIGTHKTGSTSLQRFLQVNRHALGHAGVSFYQGHGQPENHYELHMATMRPERGSPARYYRKIKDLRKFREEVASHVAEFIERQAGPTYLFSAEGLSYLRFEDEISSLRALFPGVSLETIVFIRSKMGFLASYSKELTHLGIPFSKNPQSFAYVENDSWLVDYDKLLSTYSNLSGIDNLRTFDYDDLMATDNDIITTFVKLIGFNQHADLNTKSEWLNSSSGRK